MRRDSLKRLQLTHPHLFLAARAKVARSTQILDLLGFGFAFGAGMAG
jgi:ABC-type uncharacterized transport system substrate-binding protein